MPVAFNGTLRANEIFGALYNMIISQQVFTDNIKGTSSKLVEHFRTDGTLYGDTKLYYATDILTSHPWKNDAEAENLLALDRPAAPKIQKITLSNFRQIRLTTDNYLSKRAWSTEGAFSQFNSAMLGWINETKRVYDSRLFNTYVGTTISEVGKQNQEVGINAGTEGLTGEAKARVEAQLIAQKIADILAEVSDPNRDYNDYGFMRSLDESDLMIVWNTKWINKITKLDLPTIFHKDGLISKFGEYKLLPQYFGVPVVAGKDITTAATDKYRSLTQQTVSLPDGGTKELFPGDLIPVGIKIADATKVLIPSYLEKDDIICKIIHKNSIPFMSAFQTATDFFNPRSLTENHYLTWGYSDLDYLANYPFITVNAD